jgi:eukaryotic-like serine/threonine-protein kinase
MCCAGTTGLERWLVDDAELALERVARPLDPREVVLQSARARIAEQAGDFPAAIAAHEQAYALAEGRIDDGPRAMLRVGIGTAMYRNGDYAAARAELLQAREAALAAWGQGTPEAARIEFDLGMVATDLGDVDAARQHLESAIAIDQRAWGSESIEVARDRFALAYLAFGTGEIDQGCEAIADVLAVYEAEFGVVHDETASAMNASALCRYHAGDAQGAIEGYRRVLAVPLQRWPKLTRLRSRKMAQAESAT